MLRFNRLTAVEKNSLFLILEGVAAAVVLNLFNPFIQIFARRMGAGDMQVALLNSLPPLAAVLVLIPGGLLVDRSMDKKKVTCLLGIIYAASFIPVVLVPNMSPQWRVTVYVLWIGLINVPGALYTASWQSFYSDSFKGGNANVLYSARSKYAALAGLLAVLLTGWVLTVLPGNDEERLLIYQLFYIVCCIGTLFQVFFLSRIKPDFPAETKDSFTKELLFRKGSFKEMLTNKPFLLYSVSSFAFYITWQMGWPVFFIYNADYVGMNELQLGAVSVFAGISSFASFYFWNRLINRKSGTLLMLASAFGLALNPFFYVVLQPFYVVLAVNLFAGAASAGFTMFLFCNLLQVLPESRKTFYIACFNTLLNISGFAAPLLGIGVYRYLGVFKTMLLVGILRMLVVGILAVKNFRMRGDNK